MLISDYMIHISLIIFFYYSSNYVPFFIFAILGGVKIYKNFVLGVESFPAMWDLIDWIPRIGKLQNKAHLCQWLERQNNNPNI